AVLREDAEDVAPAVGKAPAPVAPVPAQGAASSPEPDRAEAAHEGAGPGADGAHHGRRMREPEAGEDSVPPARLEANGPRRHAQEAERVVHPESALDRGVLLLVVGRADDPAPASERRERLAAIR